jgi:hypothetical protein
MLETGKPPFIFFFFSDWGFKATWWVLGQRSTGSEA